MQIKELLSKITYNIQNGTENTEITGLAIDSREVKSGDLFVATVGYSDDGHIYIESAYEKGAKAIMIHSDHLKELADILAKMDDVTVITVENTRDILSKITEHFYGYPSTKFNLIGVTGTNGKTSVATILNNVLTELGHKTGLIGTIENYCCGEPVTVKRTTPTTPDCIELGELMSRMASKGIDDFIMEASSMGLKMGRVKACEFDVAIFTNLSPEHLDDHKTMEDYSASKLMLFEQTKTAVVNMDDDFSKDILGLGEHGPKQIVRYGIKNSDACDIYAENIDYSNGKATFDLITKRSDDSQNEPSRINMALNVPSEFAVYNALACIGACMMLGMPASKVAGIIPQVMAVPGRYEVVRSDNGVTAIIDYAHTAMALENLLSSIKANSAFNKVISVFGCGGDRDKSKRIPMGEISGKYADYSVITSDNPRTEDPDLIVDEVEKGMLKTDGKYERITDRKNAIIRGLEIAGPNDVVVISGKGHENYQIIGTEKIHLDDKEIVQSYFNGT